MGNIVAGQEMISKASTKDVWGVTIPLIVNEEGNKFGKSAGAPVWLDPALTSPFNLYQFFLRLPDSQMEMMLRFFTFLPDQEIQNILESHRDRPEKRQAQTVLAKNVTSLVHGQQGLDAALKTTSVLYNRDIDTLAGLSREEARANEEAAFLMSANERTAICLLKLVNEFSHPSLLLPSF